MQRSQVQGRVRLGGREKGGGDEGRDADEVVLAAEDLGLY